MPRKIFLSFLGAIEYKPTRYYFPDNRQEMSTPIYYVQEAILRRHSTDQVYIFVTKEALEKNYLDRIYYEYIKTDDTGESKRVEKAQKGDGLEAVLARLKNEDSITNYIEIGILNGHSESEIWAVFQKVYDIFEPNDEVIVDVTFGFRSLPMLMVVLLDYAKTLRNITVKAIYYGNYEAGREEKDGWLENARSDEEKKEVAKRTVEAPILNLLPFVELQAWTYAAQAFAVGNAIPLSEITKDKYSDFSEDIDYFAKAIQTCRGLALVQNIDINSLKANIRQMSKQSDIEVVLRPLLDIVSAKLSPFESHQLSNGFAAVNWCIQHNMIQQGITFLQETLISYIVERFLGENMLTEVYERDLASSALQLFSAKKNRLLDPTSNKVFSQKNEEEKLAVLAIYTEMREFVKDKYPLSLLYKELVGKDGFRNDINHCGYREAYLEPKALNEALRTIFGEIKSLNL